MKVFHASDLHYSGSRLEEADRCFAYAIERGIRAGVDVAIISGDSTDHTLDAHAPALLALAKRIKQLADQCPVLLLQGTFSHEPLGMLRILQLVGARHPIHIAEKIGMVALRNGQWSQFDGSYDGLQLLVTAMPTVNRADLAAVVGPEAAPIAHGDKLGDLLSSFAPMNDGARARGVPTVLVGHGTIDGAYTETGVPMAGLDHEFSLGALFAAGASAGMMGHIHQHQAWHRERNGVTQVIAYPGSIGRFHYGEHGQKCALLWSIDAWSAGFEVIETPSKRMIDIEFLGIPDLNQLHERAGECAGAFVRVRYQVDEEFSQCVDRAAIRAILAEAKEIHIEGQILPVQRQRCSGISTLITVAQRFARWCEFSQTPQTGLPDRLTALMSMTAEDIAIEFAKSNRAASRDRPEQEVTEIARENLGALSAP
jgi:exonuclease SbcD